MRLQSHPAAQGAPGSAVHRTAACPGRPPRRPIPHRAAPRRAARRPCPAAAAGRRR